MSKFLWKPVATGALTTELLGPVTRLCTLVSRWTRVVEFCVFELVTTHTEPKDLRLILMLRWLTIPLPERPVTTVPEILLPVPD